MLNFICFFVAPLLAMAYYEKLSEKKLGYYDRVIVYSVFLMLINLFCIMGIVIVSKHAELVVTGSLAAVFVMKYLLISLALALVMPFFYCRIWIKRATILRNIREGFNRKINDMTEKITNYWSENKYDIILVLLSFVFFIFMMLFKLTNSPLWGDERVEMAFSQLDIPSKEMYYSVIITFQPPLYNWVMHYWLLINNESLLWFRLFNVLLGTISAFFLYNTQKRLFKNTKIACFSLLMLSVCYQWIYSVQECSEYTLMLTGLFVAVFFFCRFVDSKRIVDEILFILGCVMAMYSQYGAAFVVGPILLVFIVYVFCQKKFSASFWSVVLYLASLIIFAKPLYFNYLRTQMLKNEIATYAEVKVGVKEIFGIFSQFGLNIGYLWNLNSASIIKVIMVITGMAVLSYLVYGIIKNYKNLSAWNLLSITLVIGYILHYFLVVFHIYAMVHPNESSGFFSRYSYFYIPILAVILPGCLYKLVSVITNRRHRVIIGVVFSIIMVVGLFPAIYKNWHKGHDDEFAEAWIAREGYYEETYLCGGYYWEGFNDYVVKEYGEKYSENVHDLSELDLDNLPGVFWLWRTNWGGADFENAAKIAREKNYHEESIAYFGEKWQLIRFEGESNN